MNKLFIIGNGFDLAHELKTKYSDFLLWYINKRIRALNAERSRTNEDGLLSINGDGYQVREFNSLEAVKLAMDKRQVTIECKNELLTRLLDKYISGNWVDIEYEYYQIVLTIYRKSQKNMVLDVRRVIELNACLDLIKSQLSEYLSTLPSVEASLPSIMHNFKDEMSNVNPGDVRVLVFNYTETVEKYTSKLGIRNENVIYIHGKLNTPDNPIIFGYGNEIDKDYRNLENLNNNEILRNMKSFCYFNALNYQALNRFLNGKKLYNVVIMGHSCGISDRVLLNSIFTREACKSIKIYYHKRSETDSDYFVKTQEISRHFVDKAQMRDLIVPFPQSSPLS